jgi:hypothetical protein
VEWLIAVSKEEQPTPRSFAADTSLYLFRNLLAMEDIGDQRRMEFIMGVQILGSAFFFA